MIRQKRDVQYDSVKEKKLITLADKSFSETWLSAAKIRNHGKVFKISRLLQDEKLPPLKYHKVCRHIFALKRNLEKLELHIQDRSNNERPKWHREGSIASASGV